MAKHRPCGRRYGARRAKRYAAPRGKGALRAANAKNPAPFYTVGFQYQVFVLLNKFLPARWTNALVGMIYK
ncbi:MAG: hypothetical protein R2912_11885 [Eubacteriales bacterium]